MCLTSDGYVQSSISNFGLIPYGHSIVGNVWVDRDNLDGCEPFKTVFDGKYDPDSDPSPIVIVRRGNCSFVTKVRNIEHAGGRLALVVDKNDEDVKNVIMIDDGNGNGIRIPSMLVSKRHGEILLDYLNKEHTDDLGNKQLLALWASFEIDSPDNRVEYDFWYTSSDDLALDFLRDFKERHYELGTNVQMTPHFAFWTCKDCDDAVIKKDCFANGEYCAIAEKNLNTTGQNILMEDLR